MKTILRFVFPIIALALLLLGSTGAASARQSISTHRSVSSNVMVFKTEAEMIAYHSHLRPQIGDCNGPSCDDLFSFVNGCDGSYQVDRGSEVVYAPGNHRVGVVHLFESQGPGACYADWSGFRVDNGVCIWSNTGSGQYVLDNSLGEYNDKEENGSNFPGSGELCGNWVTSVMDESEFYSDLEPCTSAWEGASTGWGVFNIKFIVDRGGGHNC